MHLQNILLFVMMQMFVFGKFLKFKILKINYMLFTFVGNFFNASYRNGVFGEVGVVIWQNTINLTFLMITLCVSHIFGSIIKSVEDIIEHPLFSRKNAKLDAGIFYKN